jgi:triosephosphate isomerase
MRKRIIIGNWKMNPASHKDAEKLFKNVVKLLPRTKNTEVVVCPPYIYLESLKKISKKIALGAQNSYFEEVGAFTGEVSPMMLSNMGVKYVILGHSERRAQGEDNLVINKKVKEALAASLIPILCVGENTRDENHQYFNTVRTQIEECLDGISKNSIGKLIIAYEPVWALSTTAVRHDATAHDSREMAIFIRKIVADKFNVKSDVARVIYGGSANEKDAEDFIKNGGVEGLLPGRASLTAEKFAQMVKIVDSTETHAIS